jgi:hypothetical protein
LKVYKEKLNGNLTNFVFYMNFSYIFRYGWFIPERTAAGPSALLTHWRILQQKEKLSIFKPTPSQYTFVAKMAAKTKMRYGYWTTNCYLTFSQE